MPFYREAANPVLGTRTVREKMRQAPSPAGVETAAGTCTAAADTCPAAATHLAAQETILKCRPFRQLKKTIQKRRFQSGYKNIPKQKSSPIPAEADAVPSKTYRAIISSKMLKGKAGTIGGIASGQGNSECGSFFNKGDNRVLRTVYKEDIQSQSVSSLSFNPVKWVCAACPKSHPVFGGGGGSENCGCDC
jgi:hypothetical protein